jgi:hypothetical protein
MKNWLLIFCVVLFLGNLFSQEVGRTLIGRNQFLIGQQTSLTYMIKVDSKEKIPFKSYSTFIPAKRFILNSKLGSKEMIELEIMQAFHDTIVSGKENELLWVGGYKFTAWDSGYFEIPKIELSVNGKELIFPAQVIRVDLVPAKKGQDIYDIKEAYAKLPAESISFQIKNFFKSNWWWLVPVILIGLGSWIYFRWKKVTKKPIKVKVLSLKERTLMAIDALEKDKLWEKGKLKKHYIELSFIIRSYLAARYEVNLLEKTTQETKLLLTQKGLNKETIEVIVEILIQSDMVKFAKSSPDELSVLRISVLAKQIVAETSPIEFENVD